MMYFVEQMGFDFMSAGAWLWPDLFISDSQDITLLVPTFAHIFFLAWNVFPTFFMGSWTWFQWERERYSPITAILQIPAGFPKIQLDSDSIHPETAPGPTAQVTGSVLRGATHHTPHLKHQSQTQVACASDLHQRFPRPPLWVQLTC